MIREGIWYGCGLLAAEAVARWCSITGIPTRSTQEPSQEECVLVGELSLEAELSWFHWGGAALPTATLEPQVSSEPCTRFEATSDAEWLLVELTEDGSNASSLTLDRFSLEKRPSPDHGDHLGF